MEQINQNWKLYLVLVPPLLIILFATIGFLTGKYRAAKKLTQDGGDKGARVQLTLSKIASVLSLWLKPLIWWGIFVGILLVLWYRTDWIDNKDVALALLLAALTYRWLGNKWGMSQTLPWMIVLCVALKISWVYLVPALVGDSWSWPFSTSNKQPAQQAVSQARQWTRAELKQKARFYAKLANLDPLFVLAVIQQESGYKPRALGRPTRSGRARGLMQLMPATARKYGVSDPFNPDQNLRAGTQHLRFLLDHYNGDRVKALAAYNWGEKQVDKLIAKGFTTWDLMQPRLPAETRGYVSSIFAALGRPLTPLVQVARGVTQSGNVWHIEAPASRVISLDLELTAGTYRITIPETDCVKWNKNFRCVSSEGGEWTPDGPPPVGDFERFFAGNQPVGKPLLIIDGKIVPLGRDVVVELPQDPTIKFVTNDDREDLGDNRHSWNITMTKVGAG